MPTVESAILNRLDRQLVRALQIRPRASFSSLAVTLGVSEQTVARRYRRLHRDGMVRVVGVVDPRALGLTDWMIRLRCRPDGALAVAQALARREDVSWVTVNSGGTEVCFALRARTEAAREDLLLERLPKSTPVLDISAAVLLHRYITADADHCRGAEDDVLTVDQVRRLTATPRVAVNRCAELEPGDQRLLDQLAHDGRASNADLARATGMSAGRVVRRLDALVSSGVVYFDVDIALAALRHSTAAALWLQVSPARLDAVGHAIAEHTEVPFAAAIAGKGNLVAWAVCESLDGLYLYLTEKVATIEGINGYEISPVMRWIKQAGAVAAGDRLADPDSPVRVPRAANRVPA